MTGFPLAFPEGAKVDYHSPVPDVLPSGPAVVRDVNVEGNLVEPTYVIDLEGVGRVAAAQSELSARY